MRVLRTPVADEANDRRVEDARERPPGDLLLAICGGVGAAMMPHFAVYLRKRGLGPSDVLMTRAATRFVTPYAMRLHAGGAVYTDDGDGPATVPHVQLPRAARLLLVVPATANVIAKAAHGICDDLVTTAIVAAPCKVAFAPSMNGAMWFSRVVQRNVETLRDLGHAVIEPGPGLEIADLQPTFGCLRPLDQVADEVEALLEAARLTAEARDVDRPEGFAGP